jgi:hypothetical protein
MHFPMPSAASPSAASPPAKQGVKLSAIKGCRFVMEATTDIETRLMPASDVELFVDAYGWLRDAEGTRLPGIAAPMDAERFLVEPDGKISWISRDRQHWVTFGRILVVEKSVAEAVSGKESFDTLEPLWNEQTKINKSLTLDKPTEFPVRRWPLPP